MNSSPLEVSCAINNFNCPSATVILSMLGGLIHQQQMYHTQLHQSSTLEACIQALPMCEWWSGNEVPYVDIPDCNNIYPIEIILPFT